MSTQGLTITPKAAGRIRQMPDMLRITINAGGCKGFSTSFASAATPDTDDVVIEQDGAKIVIDSISLDLVQGATLDFVDDLVGQFFRLDIPQATSSCGCGTSFSL